MFFDNVKANCGSGNFKYGVYFYYLRVLWEDYLEVTRRLVSPPSIECQYCSTIRSFLQTLYVKTCHHITLLRANLKSY